MGTDIEMLAMGNCIQRKDDQDPALKREYKDAFGARLTRSNRQMKKQQLVGYH